MKSDAAFVAFVAFKLQKPQKFVDFDIDILRVVC